MKPLPPMYKPHPTDKNHPGIAYPLRIPPTPKGPSANISNPPNPPEVVKSPGVTFAQRPFTIRPGVTYPVFGSFPAEPEVPRANTSTPRIPTPDVPTSTVPTPQFPTPTAPAPHVPAPHVPAPYVPAPYVAPAHVSTFVPRPAVRPNPRVDIPWTLYCHSDSTVPWSNYPTWSNYPSPPVPTFTQPFALYCDRDSAVPWSNRPLPPVPTLPHYPIVSSVNNSSSVVQASEVQASEDKPSEDKPSEDKPSEDKPSEDKPGEMPKANTPVPPEVTSVSPISIGAEPVSTVTSHSTDEHNASTAVSSSPTQQQGPSTSVNTSAPRPAIPFVSLNELTMFPPLVNLPSHDNPRVDLGFDLPNRSQQWCLVVAIVSVRRTENLHTVLEVKDSMGWRMRLTITAMRTAFRREALIPGRTLLVLNAAFNIVWDSDGEKGIDVWDVAMIKVSSSSSQIIGSVANARIPNQVLPITLRQFMQLNDLIIFYANGNKNMAVCPSCMRDRIPTYWCQRCRMIAYCSQSCYFYGYSAQIHRRLCNILKDDDVQQLFLGQIDRKRKFLSYEVFEPADFP
ncbi:hypothetical protein BJX64DRAFT_289856 [Aspergillus heterothallicus]